MTISFRWFWKWHPVCVIFNIHHSILFKDPDGVHVRDADPITHFIDQLDQVPAGEPVIFILVPIAYRMIHQSGDHFFADLDFFLCHIVPLSFWISMMHMIPIPISIPFRIPVTKPMTMLITFLSLI